MGKFASWHKKLQYLKKYKILLEYPSGIEEVAVFNRRGDAYIAAKALQQAAPSSHRYGVMPIKRKNL